MWFKFRLYQLLWGSISLCKEYISIIINELAISSFQGHPFMESLRENKPLLYSVCGSSFVIFSLAAGWLPDVAAQFEIIDFPPEVRCCYQVSLKVLLSWYGILRFLFPISSLSSLRPCIINKKQRFFKFRVLSFEIVLDSTRNMKVSYGPLKHFVCYDSCFLVYLPRTWITVSFAFKAWCVLILIISRDFVVKTILV